MYTILIVDDELKLLKVLEMALENMGYAILSAESAEEGLRILQEREVHLVLSDLRLPGLSGRGLLEKVRAVNPNIPVVIMTAYASLKDAVEIIKEGAFDYIVKPFDLDALEATIASALRFYALSSDNKALRRELGLSFTFDNFIGHSPAFKALRNSIIEVSASSANVLVTGESGTGKELAAKAIHYNSPRADGPFITINCAAIPEQLLESELFGHLKGAFTGATESRPGRFVQADGGSLFLDEIGDMPLALQAKILRCIQEKTIEPVGGGKPKNVDVRIIAATNQDLGAAIAKGSFRQDLFYRLNVYPIVMPPLRERVEDIALLAEFFARRIAAQMGKRPITFSPEALNLMQAQAWPGNVRELENSIERLTIINAGGLVTPGILESSSITTPGQPSQPSQPSPSADKAHLETPAFPLNLAHYLEDVERKVILAALEKTGGIQVKAAELLNIPERSIWHRIKKLGINIMNKREAS